MPDTSQDQIDIAVLKTRLDEEDKARGLFAREYQVRLDNEAEAREVLAKEHISCRHEVLDLAKLVAVNQAQFQTIDSKLDGINAHLTQLNGSVARKAEEKDLKLLVDKLQSSEVSITALSTRVTLILAIGGPIIGIIFGIVGRHLGWM